MSGGVSLLATAVAGHAAVRDWPRALAGKRLLVTGAAGFIGGALFRRLRETTAAT